MRIPKEEKSDSAIGRVAKLWVKKAMGLSLVEETV